MIAASTSFVQVVVEAPVRDVGRPARRAPAATASKNCRWQSGGPANESDCDGASAIVGHGVVGRSGTRAMLSQPMPRERDVVRVHERRDREPGRRRRRSAASSREQLDDLVGVDTPSLDDPGVGLVGAVRLAADPAREPERVEAVGPAVRVDRAGVDHAVGVVRRQALVGARARARSACEMCHLPR